MKIKEFLKKKLVLVSGIITGFLGILGVSGLCCTPLVVVILGLFGISSALITKNAYLFLLVSVILFSYFYYHKKKCRK